MSITGLAIIYIIIWWIVFFAILPIDVNRVKAANDMKTRGVDAKIKSDMLGVSAGAMFSSASNVSGFMNAMPSLLTGVSSLAQNFVKRNA